MSMKVDVTTSAEGSESIPKGKRQSNIGRAPSFGSQASMAVRDKQHDSLSQKVRATKKIGLAAFFTALLSFGVVVGAVVLGTEMTKEVKASETSELRTSDGKDNLVKVGTVAAYATLVELPRQGVAFMNEMTHATLVVDGEVRKYTIDGYIWRNSTHMDLLTTYEKHIIKIANHLVYVDYADGTFGQIEIHSCNTEHRVRRGLSADSCGRRALSVRDALAEASDRLVAGSADSHTWDDLLARYVAETGRDADEHRRLQESGADALADLYAWFGGSIKANTEAKAAVNKAGCDDDALKAATVPGAPTPNLPTKSKWSTEHVDHDGNVTRGEWYMDLSDMSSPKMHLVQFEPSKISHDIMLGEEHLRYVTEPPDAEQLSAADANELEYWEYVYGGLKENCDVASGINSERTASSQQAAREAHVLDMHLDGSATWLVAGWRITVAKDGAVTAISGWKVLSITEYDEATTPTISTGYLALFETCDPDTDYQAKASELLTIKVIGLDNFADATTPEEHTINVTSMTGTFTGTFTGTISLDSRRLSENQRRRLNVMEYMSRAASGSWWCGAGTDNVNTPCPGTDLSTWEEEYGSPLVDYDLTADRACRRHDHGAKTEPAACTPSWIPFIGGECFAVKLGCDIDKDLADNATHNWAVTTVFGYGGFAQWWGCIDISENGKCWKEQCSGWGWWERCEYKWKGCSKNQEYTIYGDKRYNKFQHSWGYTDKERTDCEGDLVFREMKCPLGKKTRDSGAVCCK